MLGARDLRFFGVVALHATLAAAARALDVTPSAVTQRLNAIEARLGLRLLERGPGDIRLTEEGELLARRAARILGDLDTLIDQLATRRGTVSGVLRVVASFGFGRRHVAPVMAALSLRHESLELNLTLTGDLRGALQKESWDVLVYVGRLSDAAIVQRKLADNRRLLCAAPAYVARAGAPAHPADLGRHVCGVVREDQADVTRWTLSGPDGQIETIRVPPAFSSNDGEVIRDWALLGLGIVERSEWSVASDLQAGRLVEILPGWQLTNADVVALLNPRMLRAARIEACVDALVEALSPPPWRTP